MSETFVDQVHLQWRWAVIAEMGRRGYRVQCLRGVYRRDVWRFCVWAKDGNCILDGVLVGTFDNCLRLWCSGVGYWPSQLEMINVRVGQ